MHVLDYLSDESTDSAAVGSRGSEYRILCSGALYNGKVLTSDWRKSDVTRVLLRAPFSLYVVSRPFDDYPQELALHIAVRQITETTGQFTSTFFPDDIIARDLTSLLCVLLRRHLSVSTKVSVSVPDGAPPDFAAPGILPLPVATSTINSAWPRRPLGVMTGPAGEISIDDYNPPPLAVDPERLTDDLRAAATVPHREALILAARLYAQALQLIGTVPEIAYQLLISAVETIANSALAKYQPTRDEMIAIKGNVRNRAVQLGLTTEQAEDLAVLACADNHWISRRFRKFLISLVDDSLWTPDTLFRIPQDVVPPKENFEAVLKNIYKKRSEAVHAGQSWRETIHFGWGPTIPAAAIKYLFMGPFRDPPLVWFERVVNLALNRYLQPEGRARLPLAS